VVENVMTDTWAPEELRGYAFAIAYRMLGSVGEAEDVVQEAMIRLHAADRAEVRSPTAYTATVTTRLALDQLRSARARRERYVGTWLPEPVLGEPDPAERAELRESLTTAFLIVLETLSPLERAVFVLHDLFDLPYADVAGLERMLADDVVFHGDGGGKGPAVRQPVFGALRVARLLAGILRQAQRYGLRLEPAVVNGGPGARLVDGEDRLLNVLALDVRDDRVVAVRSVINPDKLRHLGPLVPLTELAGS
jgi:RNA polymerase sigma factor (sigma-70 family)